MAKHANVGILGIGVHLPEERRRNDWWSTATVDRWAESNAMAKRKHLESPSGGTDGEQRVRAALYELLDDPFRGAVERRVMSVGMRSSDMEILAARSALEDANVDKADIGLLLSHNVVPDFLQTNGAATVHEALGLRSDCLSLSVEGACNTFQQQLVLAEKMIQSGEIGCALLTQSCSISELLPYEEHYSAWFGDGATAVVLGPVSADRGIVASSHRTDGQWQNTLVSSVRGRRWFETGRVEMYVENMARAQDLFVSTADVVKEVIEDSLDKAAVSPREVDFYASHQATAWLRPVTQAHTGLQNARTLDTFSWAGSVFSCNVPLVLHSALQEGLVADDDLVVTFSAGNGITWSSTVMRWGR